MRLIRVYAAALLFSALSQPIMAQESSPKLPASISGGWTHSGWGGSWSLTKFDMAAKTAIAYLSPGGDSCGLVNAPAIIKMWDGKRLEVEIAPIGRCRYPVTYRLEREGNRWDGTIDNDKRTVFADGRES
jgi:hypothetical protein